MVTSPKKTLAVVVTAVSVLGSCGNSAAQTSALPRTAAGDFQPGGAFQTRFDAAKHAFDRGHFETAADVFGELAAVDSDHRWVVESKFYLAEAFVQLRRFSEAQPIYQDYLATNPAGENATFAQFRIGESAFFLDQFLVAEQALVAFIREHGNHDLAVKAQEMIRIMPSACLNVALQDFESWRKRGDAAALTAAEGRLNAYLAAYPADENHLLARYSLGRVLFEQQRYAQANAVFSTAIDLEIEHQLLPNLFAYSGEAYLRVGDPEAAGERFQHLLDHWPDSSPATHARTGLVESLVQQARADIRARQYDAARERLRKLAQTFPHSCHQHTVDDLLGQCWLQQGDHVNARKSWARILRSTSSAETEMAVKAQWRIAHSYQQQADYHEAVREYLRLATIFEQPQWQQQSYLAASECYRRLGDIRSAQRMVERSQTIMDQDRTNNRVMPTSHATPQAPILVLKN